APPPPPPPAREAARRPEGPAAPAAPAPGELARPRAATPFDFRPAREPSLGPAPAAGTGDPLTKAPEPPSLLDSGRGEISVDFVEESIKKLADALNASPPGPAAPEQGEDTEAMIERSVAALQSAARTMQAHTNPRGGRTSSWWPSGRSGKAAPPPPPPAVGDPTAPAGAGSVVARVGHAPAGSAPDECPARPHRRGGRGRAHGGDARADPRS